MAEFMNSVFPSFESFVIFLLVMFFIVIPFIKGLKNFSITARVLKQDGISIVGADIPSEEFYDSVMGKLNARNIQELRMYIENVAEGGFFSPSRRYLVLKKGDVQYYICTFSLGTSQAFTYWHIAPLGFFHNLISNIPYIGKPISAMLFPMTLYRMDVASVLNGIIKHDISESIKEIGDIKDNGLRELAEVDFKRLRELQ